MADTPTPKPSITPAAATSKKWDTIQLGIRLGCVVLLTASVVGFFCLSGKQITIEQIGLIIVAGAALAGISIARPGGGTGATLIGGGLLMITLLGCGCGGAIIPDPHPGDGLEPCAVEAAVVDGLAAAVDDVAEVLPEDSPKAEDGLAYARGIVDEGRGAVRVCEALTSEGGSGYSAIIPWISAASAVVRGIISILTAAHVDIPDSVRSVLRSLGLAQAEVLPIDREAPWPPIRVDVAVAP